MVLRIDNVIFSLPLCLLACGRVVDYTFSTLQTDCAFPYS